MTLRVVAHGQSTAVLDALGLPHPTTAKSMRYWIDDDAGSVTDVGIVDGKISVDVSLLTEGLHTIHYQVIDSDDMVAIPYSGIFLVLPEKAQSYASTLRYWYDDSSDVMTCDANVGLQSLDMSSLEDGLHTLHYQVVDTEGVASFIASGIFLKLEDGYAYEEATASELIYWFDDQENPTTVEMADGVQVLDASMLPNGLHTVHYIVVCSDGNVTSAYTSIFLKLDFDNEATLAKSMRYWFDGESAAKEVEATSGVQTLDVSHLSDGLHTVHYQLVDEMGLASIPVSNTFLKIADDVATTAKSLRYWIDDDSDIKVEEVVEGTRALDVSHLLKGLHTLHYQLVDDRGDVSVPMSCMFMKMYDGIVGGEGNAITQYMYWLNDNSKDNKKVQVGSPSSSFSLVTLLPMPKEAIRSSNFHFETTSGEPMVYAKNDFHVRFENAMGYWADDSRSFIDYSVSQKVEDIADLQSTQTFTRPGTNAVKWFSFEGEKGDTVAFRSSQAMSMQVYAPSGKEIYATSADKSVKFDGCHTWEDGTYYVAVHDVTGTRQNVTLDFMHMDRYDVVAQDVHTVGNGGCSTITFQGNGFRDLYAVELYTANGDTIHAIDIGHESDASTTATFDFTDAELGKYDALFHFTEESKTFTSILSVEEARDIELATKVSYPSTFLRGSSVTYSVEITNKGNMTAYMVPVYIWIKSKKEEDIFNVKLEGLDLPKLSSCVSSEVLTEEEEAKLKTELDNLDDDYSFMKFRVEDEDSPNDSICVRSNYFFTNIAPNSTKTINLTLSTDETDVAAYFTIAEEWRAYSNGLVSSKNEIVGRRAKSNSESWYCCNRERIECLANITCNALDIGSLFSVPGPTAINISSCVAGIVNQVVTAAGDTYCGTNDVEGDFMKKVNNIVKGINITAAVTSCASAFGVKNASEIVAALDAITHPSVVVNCLTAFMSKKPNCPPTPPQGGNSRGVNSLDPNDIYGYVAPSGSKFVGESVVTLPYRIEFENDTAFATASAHVVEIKDTLDSKLFDLATFVPTDIKIGNKTEHLDGTPNFVKTIDMRPAINAITQVEGKFDQKRGIATWTFTSLDPMTMEPTDDVMQGFLPVNHDGISGIGEVSYNISLKGKLTDGKEIPNRASIVFDNNEPILTPTWTNVIDAVSPESYINYLEVVNDSIVRVHCDGEDSRSGIWKYSIYVQYGENASWNEVAEIDTTCFDFRFYEDIEYGFCVIATDSAGNVEQ